MPQVSIHERGPSRTGLLAQGLGQALGQVGGQIAGREYQKGQLNTAIEKLRQNPGSTPIDTAINFIQAGAGIPGFEKYAGKLFPLLMQYSQAGATGEGGLPTGAEEMSPDDVRAQKIAQQYNLEPRKQLPGFMEKPGQEQQLRPGTQGVFPENMPQMGFPSNAPQAATSGQVRPVLDERQIEQQAMTLFNQRKRAGIPTTLTEAKSEIRDKNNADIAYNQIVKSETQERIKSQAESGLAAETMLTNLMPEASDEEKAIFSKMGENLRLNESGQGVRSEADFKRALAKEAEKFKNSISKVENSLDHPRWWKLNQNLMGKGKTSDQAASDMRSLLKPLLDLGLYDKSRRLLTEKGFYPEEIEKVINPIDTRTESFLNSTPKASEVYTDSRGGHMPIERVYSEADRKNLTSSLKDILGKNQNSSLLLIRKGMEDKGYDWRIFKDSINDILKSDVKLSDDQFNQLSNLDTPPLDLLDKMLHGIGIIGR